MTDARCWWGEDGVASAYRLLHVECHCERCEVIAERLERYLGLVEARNGLHSEYDRAAEIRRVAMERGWSHEALGRRDAPPSSAVLGAVGGEEA